jgi:CMP-N-acetylneuraminic acid synthetase
MILGVTPARGGSKGIPRKNIKPIFGKPLIEWTIEAARQSKLLDEYVVSTEDEEIGQVAVDCGARVIWRPPELAGDEIPTVKVLRDALDQIQADTVVLLQPTSPIRDPNLIDRCIEKFLSEGADSLATGSICKSVEYGKNVSLPRQRIEGFFYDDGNVYVIKADLIEKGDRFGDKIEQVLLDREQNIEIDDEFDFWLAEQILIRRQGR